MIRYKLTTQEKTTHKGYKLPEKGIWFYPENTKETPKPCSNTVLHHYSHPLLAVLFNPIHACYNNPRLFEIEIRKERGTDGMKGWCTAQKIVKEIEIPVISTEQRVEFAIRCAMLVYNDTLFIHWANGWIKGINRSAAADAARAAAHAAARAAAACPDINNKFVSIIEDIMKKGKQDA